MTGSRDRSVVASTLMMLAWHPATSNLCSARRVPMLVGTVVGALSFVIALFLGPETNGTQSLNILEHPG
jgi:hypothetical protein